MGFWDQLFIHNKRLGRIQFRRYNVLVAELFQIFTFCCLLGIACLLSSYYNYNRRQLNTAIASGKDGSFYSKGIHLWYFPYNNDTEQTILKIANEIEFNYDVNVSVRGFKSEEILYHAAQSSFYGDIHHCIFIVEVNKSSHAVDYTLRRTEGSNTWQEMAFVFMSVAHGLGQINVTYVPLSCDMFESFQNLLSHVIFYICLVNGCLVAYCVGKERSHNVHKAIGLLGGSISAYVMAWYLHHLIKSLGLTFLYCLFYYPITLALGPGRDLMGFPYTFMVVLNVIAASFIAVCLLIRNTTVAVAVTTGYHVFMYLVASMISCNYVIGWWAFLIPHLLLACPCFDNNSPTVSTSKVWSCYLCPFFYYILFVMCGCLSMTSVASWPDRIKQYFLLKGKKIDGNVAKVIEDPLLEKDHVAFKINFAEEMQSIVPRGFTFKVPFKKTTVILDATGTWQSSVLEAVVGKGYGVTMVKHHEPTVCMCPSYNFISGLLSVRDTLKIYRKIVIQSEHREQISIEHIIEDFGLKNKLSTQVKNLSLTDKKLLTLAVSFMSNAEILIFDDPTRILRDISLSSALSYLKRKRLHTTVLITCSNGEDAIRIADRIAVVVDGKIRIFGTVQFVTMCLGVGTHIKMKLISNECVKDLFLYIWLFAPKCICLNKLNVKEDVYDDTSGVTLNFIISKQDKKIIEFITLNLRSKMEDFDIVQLNISDVGIETILDRCKDLFLLESLFYHIHQHSIFISNIIDQNDLVEVEHWLHQKEAAIKYSNIYLDKQGIDTNDYSSNSALTKPARSDISFRDFMKVVTQRYHLDAIFAASDNEQNIKEIEEECEIDCSNDMIKDQNQSNIFSGLEICNQNSKIYRQCFALGDYFRNKHCVYASYLFNRGDIFFRRKNQMYYESKVSDTVSVKRLDNIIPMKRFSGTYKYHYIPTHYNCDLVKYRSKSSDTSLKTVQETSDIEVIDCFNPGQGQSLDSQENNIFLNCGSEEHMIFFTPYSKTNSFLFGDRSNACNKNISSHQEKQIYLHNTNNNSDFDLLSTKSKEGSTTTTKSDNNDSHEDTHEDLPNNFTNYYNMVIWGLNNKQPETHEVYWKESGIRGHIDDVTSFQLFQRHGNALLGMSFYHQWRCWPLILIGILLAFLVENGFFLATSNRIANFVDQSKPLSIEEGIIRDNSYRVMTSINAYARDYYDLRGHCEGLTVDCFSESLVTGYLIPDHNERELCLFYNKNSQDAKMLSTLAALEKFHSVLKKQIKNLSGNHSFSITTTPLFFYEVSEVFLVHMKINSASAAIGITLASVCVIVSVILTYTGKALYNFQNLLILSGVSGVLVYLTQLFVCFWLYFVIMMVIHLFAAIINVELQGDWTNFWDTDSFVLFVLTQFSYAVTIFGVITLLLQLVPSKLPLGVWTIFEAISLIVLHTSNTLNWIEEFPPWLTLALLFMSPTCGFTKTIFHTLQYSALIRLIHRTPKYALVYTNLKHTIQLSMVCLVSDEFTSLRCVGAAFQFSLFCAAIHFIQFVICFNVYVIIYIIRQRRRTKMNDIIIPSSLIDTSRDEDFKPMKLYNLQAHPKFTAQGQADQISATCRPYQCLALYGTKDNSGVSSIIQLIIGEDVYKPRVVMIGGEYFPQFSILSSTQRIGVGYCPKRNGLNPVLTGRDTLYLFSQIRNCYYMVEAIEKLLYVLSLHDVADDQIYTYSFKDKKKLCVALALVGDPHVLLLDHPTQGVGYLTKTEIWSVIDAYRQAGHIVIVASDCADECCALATKVSVIRDGCIRLSSDMASLTGLSTGYFTYVWLARDSKGIPVPIVRVIRDVQRRFRSGMFSLVENVRDPYILFSFAGAIPEFDHAKIFDCMENLRECGLIKRYMVREITPPLVLDAYKNNWLPY